MELMSPVLVAVITVLFALTMVTTEKVFGLPFLGNDSVEGADNTQGGGDPSPAPPVGSPPSPSPSPEGDPSPSPSPGGDPSPSQSPEGDPSPSPSPDGDPTPIPFAGGSSPSPGVSGLSIGLSLVVPTSSVEGVELSVISPISLSWKLSLPIVTSPAPERCMVLGRQQSLFS